jgi:ubiquinone/menaquinone biosynthesis C-methylase UbiE
MQRVLAPAGHSARLSQLRMGILSMNSHMKEVVRAVLIRQR